MLQILSLEDFLRTGYCVLCLTRLHAHILLVYMVQDYVTDFDSVAGFGDSGVGCSGGGCIYSVIVRWVQFQVTVTFYDNHES